MTPKGLKHTARLFCMAPTKAYKDGWDRLFGGKKAKLNGLGCGRCRTWEHDECGMGKLVAKKR